MLEMKKKKMAEIRFEEGRLEPIIEKLIGDLCDQRLEQYGFKEEEPGAFKLGNLEIKYRDYLDKIILDKVDIESWVDFLDMPHFEGGPVEDPFEVELCFADRLLWTRENDHVIEFLARAIITEGGVVD